MADEGFEFLSKRLAGDEIHHITAVRSACCNGTRGIDKWQLARNVGKTLLQILIWATAPIACNGIGKGRAKGGGSRAGQVSWKWEGQRITHGFGSTTT